MMSTKTIFILAVDAKEFPIRSLWASDEAYVDASDCKSFATAEAFEAYINEERPDPETVRVVLNTRAVPNCLKRWAEQGVRIDRYPYVHRLVSLRLSPSLPGTHFRAHVLAMLTLARLYPQDVLQDLLSQVSSLNVELRYLEEEITFLQAALLEEYAGVSSFEELD